MGPDFEIGLGKEVSEGVTRPPRPTLLVRVIEILGLGLVGYGLPNHSIGPVALGVLCILGSYALYRRRNGVQTGGGSAGGPDADSGGGSD